jgi:hypothetical protein
MIVGMEGNSVAGEAGAVLAVSAISLSIAL